VAAPETLEAVAALRANNQTGYRDVYCQYGFRAQTKPRTVDAMVRDAPAALARARLARTRTTHSPTPYLTSGERSRKFNLPTTTVTIVTLVTTDCTRDHRSLIHPECHLQQP